MVAIIACKWTPLKCAINTKANTGLPCSGNFLFDCPAITILIHVFHLKEVSWCAGSDTLYYKSSIMLPLAHEQVNPLLQSDYCCVICQKSWLQYLLFKYWQSIVSFILIWHIKAFLWQTCLSLLLFLLLALFFCLSHCLSCSLSQSLSLFWLQIMISKTWLPTWVVTKLKCKHRKMWSLRLKRSCRMEDVSMSVFFQSIASKPAPPSLPPGTFT